MSPRPAPPPPRSHDGGGAGGGAAAADAAGAGCGDAPELEAAVRRAGCGVFWLDEDLRVRRANAAFARFCGRSEHDLIGTPVADLDPVWPYGEPPAALRRLRAENSAGHAARLARPGADPLPVQVHLNYLSLGGMESVFGVAVDVSDRQAAEDALRLSEARYRAVTEVQTEFILRTEPGGERLVTFCNPAFARLVDLGDPAEVVGRPVPDMVHPDDRAAVEARFASLTPDHPIAAGENRVLGPGGEVLWTSWVNRGIFAPPPPGEPAPAAALTEVQCVGRDVTDRVLSDAALNRVRARYASLVEDSPDLVSRWRPDGTLTYANRAYFEFFDLPPGSASDHNVLDDLDDVDRAKLERSVAAMTPARPLARVVTRRTRADGSAREIEWIERGFFGDGLPADPPGAGGGSDAGDAPRLAEVQSVGRDATERRETRRRLLQSERRLRAVLDDMDEMVIRWRPGDHVYTYANAAFCRARGLPAEEIVDKIKVLHWADEDDAREIRDRMAAVTPERPGGQYVLTITGPGGATRWEEWTGRAIYSDPDPRDPAAGQTIIEYQSVGRDVTDQIAAESRRRDRAAAAAKLAALSPREREVLTAVADGTTNKVIARTMGITERTVEKHRSAAMRKLGVRSAAELVRVAVAAEDVPPPVPPVSPPAGDSR